MSLLEKKLATAITAAICTVREEISSIQLTLVDTIDARVNELSVPVLEKFVDRINSLGADQTRLLNLIESKSNQIIEEHIHNNTIQHISVDLPDDVIRQPHVDDLKTKLEESFSEIFNELKDIKENSLPELAHTSHLHDGVYANYNHYHDDIWSELRTLTSLQTDDRQKTLEFNTRLLNRFEKNDSYLKAELLNLISHIEESKEKIWKDFNDHSDVIENKFNDLISNLTKSVKVLESDIGIRIKGLDKEYQLLGEELQDALKKISNKVNDGLESKADVQHFHPEFKTFAQKNHDHKELNQLDKRIGYIEKSTFKKSDLNDLTDNVLKKIPKPKDGKDGLSWEFKFDKTDSGMLMFRKEGDSLWNKQDLRGPRGLAGKDSGGGGFGGGGGGSILDITKNGSLVGRGITSLDFIGTVNVTNPTSGVARIEIIGGGGGGASLIKFEKMLSGKLVTIDQSEHNLYIITSITVLNSARKEVGTVTSISINNIVTIESNIDLTDHIAIIIGE